MNSHANGSSCKKRFSCSFCVISAFFETFAMYIVNIADDDKSSRVNGTYNGLQSPELLPGDHAVGHVFGLFRVRANGWNEGHAPIHIPCDLVRNLGCMVTNDHKCPGRICTFLNKVDDFRGDEYSYKRIQNFSLGM